jgi:hypothetical protein
MALPIFREGVTRSPSPNEGSGEGAAFQALCKSCPAFAVEAAAVGLRTIRTHWGPITRREAEVRSEADSLLQQVQSLADAAAPVVVTPGPVPAPTPPVPWPWPWQPPTDPAIVGILQRLKGLEQTVSDTVGTTTQTRPATPAPQPDLASIQQDIAHLGGMFAQFTNQLGQLPTTGLPPQIVQIEQSVTRLGQIVGALSQTATTLSGPAAAGGAAPEQALSPIDKLLGGSAFVGLKTPIAIFGYLGLWVLQSLDAVGTVTGDKATTTGSVLTALFSGLGAAGVTAKFDRAFQALSAISGVLQKLPGQPPSTPPKADG